MPRPKNPVRRRLLALGVGLVVMALGMTVGPSLARVQSGVSLEIVVHQANCPGTLVSTTSTESAAYAKATVRNTSRQQVRAIAFGVAVHSPGASGSKPQFIKGPRIPVTIEPGASVELETGLDAAAVSRALKAGRDGGRAELGLLIVDSEDGLNWRSIADRLGHFGTVPPKDARTGYCVGALPTAFAFGPQDGGVFKCEETSNHLYCTNHNTSCTTTECPSGSCAMQTCSYTVAD